MQPQPNHEQDERRRISDAATGVFFVPGHRRGHWTGAVLFCATLIGAAMVWSGLPMAMSVARGEAPDQATAATFLLLYGAMAVLPIAGWALWASGRRWAALAVSGLFAVCVAGLGPVL